MSDKERLKKAILELKHQFGEGVIMSLDGNEKIKNVEVISTGSISLNKALGVGGIPKGRIIEIFGPESSGKTTLALHIVREIQKNGGEAAFIDMEHALDIKYAKDIGIDLSRMKISQPDMGEEAMIIMETLAKTGEVDLIVIDSVSALTPKAEVEGKIGDNHIALLPRLMSQTCRKISPIASKTGTTIIFINQIRMKIETMFGNRSPETTSGGRALRFHSSVRLDIRKISQLKVKDETVGIRVRVKVVKNKVASPFKQAEFDILFNEGGISWEADLINTGINLGIVNRSGNTYSFKDNKLGVGLENSRLFLKENDKVAKEIEKEINK
jgi:recombination protein RecA